MPTISLPIATLRPYQKPLWNYMLQEKAGLRALSIWPRRNGKDLTAINILVAKALQRPGLYQYIAPYAVQVRLIIWDGRGADGKAFLDYIPKELITRKLDQQMKVWLTNGSIISLVGSDNPDAIVGSNPLGQVYTEFSLHKPEIWQYMRPVLAENGGWALFNGTPRGRNHMYELAQVAKANSAWFYEHLTADDTGYPSIQDIDAERAAGMPESLVQQEFYTSWEASSEETLIPLDFVVAAVDRRLPRLEYAHQPRIIGVDPAYAVKGDRAVIARRQGRQVFDFEVYQGIDPMALAARVANVINEFNAHWCFVDAGRGEAVWSRLHQLGYGDRVVPVNFGGATFNDLYMRKKDEIWDRMKKAICDPVSPIALPNDPDLIKDLTAPTFTINDKGKFQVENKASLRSRGVRSTDLADALALTWAEDTGSTYSLAAPVVQDELGPLTEPLHQTFYSPLDYMDVMAGQHSGVGSWI